MYYRFVASWLLEITVLAVGFALVMRFGWKRPSGLRRFAVGAAVSVFPLLYFLVALEVLFYVFGAQSDLIGVTLASKRWTELYWKPVNTAGLRDAEQTAKDCVGKRVVFVLGDSFAAGAGIRDYRKRFSGVLQRKLGNEWRVVSIARPGWETEYELQALKVTYPDIRPDVIVLSYYINDISLAAELSGAMNPMYRIPAQTFDGILGKSHLMNFVYWRVYRLRNLKELDREYRTFLARSFSNPRIWSRHERDLEAFADYADRAGARLVVVAFPDLGAVKATRKYSAKAAGVFRRRGVPVVDMGERLAGKTPETLIVNTLDTHPNETVHAAVGQELAETIGSLPLATAR